MSTGSEPAQVSVGLQRERVRVVHEVPGYYWRCELCGWLGTGHMSLEAALREAGLHTEEAHGLDAAIVKRVDWASSVGQHDGCSETARAKAPCACACARAGHPRLSRVEDDE